MGHKQLVFTQYDSIGQWKSSDWIEKIEITGNVFLIYVIRYCPQRISFCKSIFSEFMKQLAKYNLVL